MNELPASSPENRSKEPVHALARSHSLKKGKPTLLPVYRKLPTLNDWLKKVGKWCRDPDSEFVRAADWFLDNDYHISRAVLSLEEDLPLAFYKRLPAIANGTYESVPRISSVAHAMYDSIRPHLSLDEIATFAKSYQEVEPLTNAELWALPSILRLVCLENIAGAFQQIDPALAAPFDLTEDVNIEHSHSPVDRIASAITNIISVHSIKWPDFIDQTSPVEAILQKDPSGVYPQMNFEARNRYRSMVEALAEKSPLTETQIADTVLKASKQVKSDSIGNHVGYWLIGEQKQTIEKIIGYQRSIRRFIKDALSPYIQVIYFGALFFGFVAALSVPIVYISYMNPAPLHWAVGIALSVLPATVLSITVVHWFIANFTKPVPLPEFDFESKISHEFPTAIVVPVILNSEDEISAIIEKLEVKRLANPDPILRFVLLSDLTDANAESLPSDKIIETKLRNEIRRLNQRFGDVGNTPFILMHRKREFNANERCWMAWERKRGKLEQFNRFILNGEAEGFSIIEGGSEQLRTMRYAIVLDADTELPPGSAARLVGMIAHPLNKARFDDTTGKLVSGYTILQPRVEILPRTGSGTRFSHFYSGDTAIDIYSRAASDVYQDLFESGIFTGKGIYDIAAFDQTLAGRIPENQILSHDLFEGIHGRAGLASNIVLYEDFPETYMEYALRLHRWVRGDWQLVPWLRRKVPSASGEKQANELSLLDRWKLLDNLRRSLLPPALLLFFVGAWMILPGSAVVWTLLAVAAPGSYLLGELYTVVTGGIRNNFFSDTVHRFSERGGRWFLSIVFLVNDTLVSTDAIIRTLWRVLVSKKNLMKWKSAAHTTAIVSSSNSNISRRLIVWRFMWPSSAIAALLTILLGQYNTVALPAAVPVLLLWFISPEIAIWSARQRRLRRETLDDASKKFLRQVARRTWHFFETFTGPTDNWLPPDNFQQHPKEIIAHRTSPTNIGMYLVSSLAARDFGFITGQDFLVRTRNTLDTLDRLKSHRGHVFNWYDTRSLDPLDPQYVSTVDSGNLAVALVAIQQGCLEADQAGAVSVKCWEGLGDTLDVLMEAFNNQPITEASQLRNLEQDIKERITHAINTPLEWNEVVNGLLTCEWPNFEKAMADILKDADDISHIMYNDIQIWLDRVGHHLRAMRRDFDYYYPWADLFDAAPVGMEILAGGFREILTPELSVPGLIGRIETCLDQIAHRGSNTAPTAEVQDWLDIIQAKLLTGKTRHEFLLTEFETLATRASDFAYAMDFSFLYDQKVRLFSIGYNVSSGRLDPSHYDLLATEARLASFFALAKHDAPIEHWQFLSRPITRLAGKPSILSWNGSMFEYLMPPLFLPSNRDTLLGESELTSVDHQRRYAKKRGIPWGISESAFSVTDSEGNYQYRAFGVPGLGLRRDLGEDLVVAPYASALALCLRPATSVENLKVLEKLGALSSYGFWDALDFTPKRSISKERFVPVKTWMAHHQGMTIAAILNVLRDDILVKRVLREKPFQAIELMLQERVPWELPIEKVRIDESRMHHPDATAPSIPGPWVPSTKSSVPQMHVLGNGHLSSIISEAGGGGLSWQNHAITRWLPDPTQDSHGCWIYVQDSKTGDLWSVGRHPIGLNGDESKTIFHQHMVETFRRNNKIAIRMETTVAPFDDVEIRRLTITNEGEKPSTLTITSYGEVVLAPPLDDERHPTFSKLFVKSTFLPEQNGLLYERRARRPEDKPPVLLHMLKSADPSINLIAHETDRARFLQRNGNQKSPLGLKQGLSQTTGWTLDPVMALQVQLKLAPGETKQFSFVNIVGQSRGQIVQIAETLSTQTIDRAFRDAALDNARKLARLDVHHSRLPELQVLSSLLLNPSPYLRTVTSDRRMKAFGQPDLWRFGISGDLPIFLLKMSEDIGSPLPELLIKAQRIWHDNGLLSDLVIMRTGIAGYEEPLRERILSILRETHSEGFLGRTGGIHLISTDQMDASTKAGLESAAHISLSGDTSNLLEELDRVLEIRRVAPVFEPIQPPTHRQITPPTRPERLAFENGYGGFDLDTRAYVIRLETGQHTPAPWCNVLANDTFGTIVSEAGLGFTWSINSGENRLTPWSNDPVENSPGEVVYLRDEMTAEKWTVTPAPWGHGETCQIHHGKGYSRWQQNSHELEQELLVFIPVNDPVKIVRLRLKNHSDHDRRITTTYYAEWLLGALGSVSKPHTIVRFDPNSDAIIARNDWNPEFEGRAAFLTASLPPNSVTGDRHDFLGREQDAACPQAVDLWNLGGNFTPGGDPCAAYQVHLDIPAGEISEVVFILGEADQEDGVRNLANKWKASETVDAAFNEVIHFWGDNLGAVQVKTPDSAFDLMINQWLPYQNLSCRIMARAAFYQAGGAYGFRDQLQDMLPLLYSDPTRVRDHILFAAHSQFQEGDVLHWWHPPAGRGVRTRCSDDYLWLVYLTARYIKTTGDTSILDVEVPFLKAAELGPEEGDRYARFDIGETGRLFDHCARALERAMKTGKHGLPLVGTGDWNDGMDRIGDEGRGESVWLAWFLIAIIGTFSPFAQKYGYPENANRWRRHAAKLNKAIHDQAWDGGWFVRAFDDEGEPWGSNINEECQIDSIAQSWSVLSGAPINEHCRMALDSAWNRLVSTEDRLVRLLDPPFDMTKRGPGYIQAYPPGVRENGGQYTHAATWLGLAYARIGDGERAKQVFDILNPINRTKDHIEADHYLREPYVLPGDVSGGDLIGRGGWSWYTGAAGWTWQLGVEGIMGIQLKNGSVQVAPSLPTDWRKAEVTLVNKRGSVVIEILDPDGCGFGVVSMTVDGKHSKIKSIRFPGKGKTLKVVVHLGQTKKFQK